MSVSKLKIVLTSTLFSATLCFTQVSFAVEKDVHIGVLAVWGEKITRQMWQPTINYLNKIIPEHYFILIPLKLKETTGAVKQNKVRFLLTNPGNYIELEARFGISRLATLKTKGNLKPVWCSYLHSK